MLSVHGGSTIPTYDYTESVNTIALEIKTPVIEEKEEEPTVTSDSILCNCYAYVRSKVAELPHTSVILNNLSDSGNVAVFYYPTSNVYHYAVVEGKDEKTFTVSETNFRTCAKSTRVLDKSYKRLLGFYTA